MLGWGTLTDVDIYLLKHAGVHSLTLPTFFISLLFIYQYLSFHLLVPYLSEGNVMRLKICLHIIQNSFLSIFLLNGNLIRY